MLHLKARCWNRTHLSSLTFETLKLWRPNFIIGRLHRIDENFENKLGKTLKGSTDTYITLRREDELNSGVG